MRELRYACRSLRRAPWYSATVVGVLASGIALATVVFAVVDGILFKPLPYPRPEELFVVRAEKTTAPKGPRIDVSYLEIDAWSDTSPDVVITGVSPATGRFKRTSGREFWSAYVDERFFDAIGVRPMLGGFTADDFDWFQPDQGRAILPVVVSYRYWQQQLGGDPSAVGRVYDRVTRGTIAQGHRIAGILPPDFVFPVDADEPEPEVLLATPGMWRLRNEYVAVVRVPPRTSLAAVRDRFTAALRMPGVAPGRTGHDDPEQQRRFDSVRLAPAVAELGARERRAFTLTSAATGVLLLLACVNVAGLTTARHVERRRELAVRRALGAGVATIARSLLAECAILAAVGAAFGLLLAKPLLLRTIALLPPTVTLLKTPAIDLRVFAAVGLIAVAAVAIVALWPLRMALRASGPSALGTASSHATAARRNPAFVVVAAQVTLGFVLLTAGALTIKSVATAWLTDAGFRRDRMIVVEAYVSNYTSSADATRQLGEIEALLARLPGVDRVATSSIQPLFSSSTGRAWTTVMPRGSTRAPEGVALRRVSANFFDVLGFRLVDGRWPSSGEWSAEQPVALVSETAARTLWQGQSAIGQALVPERPRPGDRPSERIVIGIVADARYRALDREPIPDIYVPERFEIGRTGAFFHVRTTGRAADVLPLIVSTLTERKITLTQASTHEDALFASVRHRALPAWLFGSLGIAALLLASTGILGLLAMSAAQRTREMGVRIALGATTARIVALLVREQLGAVVIGLLAGGTISLWTVRFAESQLYRVHPYDPSVWAAVAVTLVTMAVAGTLIPSLRAARVDPVEALRAE